MKKRVVYILVVCLVTVFHLYGTQINYYVDPQLDSENPSINVTLKAFPNSEGYLELVYMNNAWGQNDLFDCLADISVSNEDAKIRLTPERNRIYIYTGTSEQIEIKYKLVQDYSGDLSSEKYYRPIINSDFYHLFGHRLFILPLEVYQGGRKTNIDISTTDPSSSLNTIFGERTNNYYLLDRDDLWESVVMGANVDFYSLESQGAKINLFVNGSWKNSSNHKVLKKIESILTVQRVFWDDFSDKYYNIALIEIGNGNQMIGGVGLTNGFSAFNNDPKRHAKSNLVGLYYHEIMHHWIGGKIKMKSHFNELWFSEGFTEYFAYQLMYENKDLSSEAFESIINEYYLNHLQFGNYYNKKDDVLALNSYKSNSITKKIPYQKGLLYALYLDQRIRTYSHGSLTLRDLILDVFHETNKLNQRFTNDLFEQYLMKYCPEEELANFHSFILNGDVISLNDLEGPIINTNGDFIRLRRKFQSLDSSYTSQN